MTRSSAPSLSHSRLLLLLRVLLPFGLMALLELLRLLPWPLPGLPELLPWFALSGTFVLSLHYPGRCPYSALFLLGIYSDALLQMPLGLSSLLLMACKPVIASQRRLLLANHFGLQWLVFAGIASLVMLLQWLLFGLYHGQLFMPDWRMWMGTMATYPVLYRLFLALLK